MPCLVPASDNRRIEDMHTYTYCTGTPFKHHVNIACLDLIRLISVNLYFVLEIIRERAQLLSIHLVSSQAVYYIDPQSVEETTRVAWCQAQISSCPLLCLQLQGESSTTADNRCEASDLSYSCICGNGLTPNLTEYSQTLPYFTCTEFGSQCVENCNGNSLCQSACRADHPCGAQNPIKVNLTTVTTASATKTNLPAGATSDAAGIVYNGLGGAATTPASDSSNSQTNTQQSGAEIALGLGHSYGLAVVFTGVFAGFALVL
ncbi:hypothetical protein LZ554_008437 [Drepanopeziza brunnea f. sp. 'monogermtubi']|nr:hypothetical protein LZ554_008437 [Drepanopeziza brunnea f. sp. 'monogermtubi']